MPAPYPQPRQFIAGQWQDGTGSTRRQVVNPADETVLAEWPQASAADLDRALDAAALAFKSWRAVAPQKRADILLAAARLLRERQDDIARLASTEQGQPFEEGKSYVLRAAEIIDWDANEGRRVYGRIVPAEPALRMMVVREPVGPVAAFTPWNAPVFTPCRKIGSALAAGCSLIMKAAEETPASTMAVVQAFVDAGVPAGVLNLVYGDPAEISAHLIASPVVRLVTFTGSVPVGKHLAQLAAREMKPVVMELGGHAPVIVCADADIDAAVRWLVATKFRNAGQACLAPSRFYVERAVYERFVAAFVAAANKIRVGAAFEPGITMGPLANARRLATIQELVDDAAAKGAQVVAGGRRIGASGYLFQPTVLTQVPETARILTQEPFGPVAVIAAVDSLDEAIARANSLAYGLAGYVFTRSAANAGRLSRELECGTVGINHTTVSTTGVPFGGVKDSGYGREGGTEGVEGYTIAKTISHLQE